jgi:transposase
LRGVALDRRNYLLPGLTAAANALPPDQYGQAIGVDPEAWLRHMLARIADHPVSRVEDFLPWNCADQLARA